MLDALNAALVDVVLAPDPRAALAAARARADLPPDARAALLSADDDGVVLTGLIVRRLRFERLLAGDAALRAAFADAPATVIARFERYAAAVPPRSFYPADEVAAFHAFERAAAP